MRHFLRYTLLLFLLAGGIEASAQQGKTWKEMHKVKKRRPFMVLQRTTD